MYSTKYSNKNVLCDQGRYITVGDPYSGSKEARPGRWRDKQFIVPQEPANAGSGYFGYGGAAFSYASDPYAMQIPYLKTQPMAQRKLGFGTHDASKRDEFTQTIRTEQYRGALRKEQARVAVVTPEKVKMMMDRPSPLSPRAFVEGKEEIRFTYDVGRKISTDFDPKAGRDQFYSMKESYTRPKRLGGHSTASQEVGNSAWTYKYQKPDHASPSGIKLFFDTSHLGSPGK